MDSAVHAIIMAFSIFIFVIGLTVSVYMFSQVTTTAETLLYFSDKTNYYDNIQLNSDETNRKVDVDTIIPTLYRYYKENFCVKICDVDGELVHIFDVNLEGDVRKAAATPATKATKKQAALKSMYNDKLNQPQLYLFEAPWIGSTDEQGIKSRIDYFINGKAGYINNSYVDYTGNKFYNTIQFNLAQPDEANKIYFIENFISYTFTGETMTNEEGEILVEGAKPEDKIVIIYTATKAMP